MGFLDDVASDIGQSLEKSVTDYAKGQINSAVGGSLAYLFADQDQGGAILKGLPGALAGAPLSPQQLITVQSDILQQGAAIIQIANQLQFMSQQVQALSGRIANIEALLEKIHREALYIAWSNRNNLMIQDITAIDTTYQQYADYMAEAIGLSSHNIERLALAIVNPTTGMSKAATDLSRLMLSQGGQDKGALQLWSEMVTPLVAAGLLHYREAVSQYTDYYSKLTYSQLRATNLLVEAYHFIDNNIRSGMSRRVMDEYKDLLLGQENQFIQFLVPLVAAGAAQFPWDPPGPHGGFYAFTRVDAAMEMHPGIQWLPGDADATSGYYAPTSIFMAAERLLANLYVTKPSDRRIVVHTMFGRGADGVIRNAINAVPLTLEYRGSNGIAPTGQTIAPQTTQFGPYDYPLTVGGADPDWTFQSAPGPASSPLPAPIFLNRQVYATADGTPGGKPIGDGVYSLRDLNGHAGLVPMSTYMYDNVPFQEQRVLGHRLQIGPAAPFDFMNFAAYAEGIPWVGDTAKG